VVALFFLLLFLRSYVSFIDNPNQTKWVWGALATTAIICGVFTRLALLPLMCVPFAFACWKVFKFKRVRPKADFLNLLPGLISAVIILAIFTSLDLFHSFQLARQFSSMENFREQFSVMGFSILIICSFQFGLLSLKGARERLLIDDRFLILVLTALGIGALLFLGKIAPWLRYGAPLGILGLLSFLYFAQERFSQYWTFKLALYGIAITNLVAVFLFPNILD
jgi:hypothetical protein